MLRTQAERELPYDRAALFDLAADLEDYPFYLPGWIEAHIEQRQGDWCQAVQTVGYGPARLRFRTSTLLCKPERIEVTSDDAQFRHFNFLWQFEDGLAGGCRVALSVAVELRSRILQRSIEVVAPIAAGEILRAFEGHARQRLKPSGLG